MILELLVGLLIIGLLALAALFVAKGSRKRANAPTDLATEQLRPAEEFVEKPRNKANMDQPQEEFIAPEGAHANADLSKR